MGSIPSLRLCELIQRISVYFRGVISSDSTWVLTEIAMLYIPLV